MDVKKQLEICYANYKRWKEKAFNNLNFEGKKALERAFFWLEIHSAIYAVSVLESKARSKDEKKILLEAKRRIVEKLNEYEKTLLNDMNESI